MKYLYISIIVLLTTVSCTPLQYQFYNPKVSSTEDYRTFVVLNNCEESQDIISENQQRQVEVAFSNELYSKGLRDEQYQIADLIVSYYVKVNKYEIQDICFDDYDDYLLGPKCMAKVRTYKINALVIDFFDTEENSIVFHSAIEGLDFHNPKLFSKELDSAIAKIMNKFNSKKIIDDPIVARP